MVRILFIIHSCWVIRITWVSDTEATFLTCYQLFKESSKFTQYEPISSFFLYQSIPIFPQLFVTNWHYVIILKIKFKPISNDPSSILILRFSKQQRRIFYLFEKNIRILICYMFHRRVVEKIPQIFRPTISGPIFSKYYFYSYYLLPCLRSVLQNFKFFKPSRNEKFPLLFIFFELQS